MVALRLWSGEANWRIGRYRHSKHITSLTSLIVTRHLLPTYTGEAPPSSRKLDVNVNENVLNEKRQAWLKAASGSPVGRTDKPPDSVHRYRERKCAENYNKWHNKFIFLTAMSILVISNHSSTRLLFLQKRFRTLSENCTYILALEMASPGNEHCANCIGTLSFPIACVGREKQTRSNHGDDSYSRAWLAYDLTHATSNTYRVTVTYVFCSMSVPVGFCRHLVGKTVINVCHCDSA